ncbi:MAG: 50S ribosomal protein L9 [Calditrichaeota bacterium]|nr:50S ribosomal protein L9 [Calditrichota bacterium]
MKVILRESYENLGRTGDVVDVKPGFARNFLVPHGIAYPSNEFYRRRFTAERDALLRRDEERRTRAETVAERASGAKLEFKMRVSERGQMFGAITNANIAEKLAEQGVEVDRRKIVLPQPIKNLGEHTVVVRPHGDVEFELLVHVVPESAPEALRELSIRELVEGVEEEGAETAAAEGEQPGEGEPAGAGAGEEPAAEEAEKGKRGKSDVEIVEIVEAKSSTAGADQDGGERERKDD